MLNSMRNQLTLGQAEASMASFLLRLYPESYYVQTSLMRKNYGFTDFNPVFTKFNFTNFLHTSIHRGEYMQHIKGKRTSKHDISMIISSQLNDGEGMYSWQLCGVAFMGKFLSLMQYLPCISSKNSIFHLWLSCLEQT